MKVNFNLRLFALFLAFSMVINFCGCTNEKQETNINAEPIRTASIVGEYALGDEDPDITLEIKNTEAVENLSAGMFTLTGLFSELEITEISQNDTVITLSTSGTIPFSTPMYGGVDISPDALAAKVALSADCDILYRGATVKQDSFSLSDSKLSFSLAALNDSFAFTVGDKITSGELEFSVESVSNDKTTVTLSVPCNKADIDGAIDEIRGIDLSIPSDKTSSKTALFVNICADVATLGATVDYIVEADEKNTYEAAAVLFIKNGDWAEELTTDDIVLGGDFENAIISSLTLGHGRYNIEFSFTKDNISLDNINLEGSITVSNDKIKNLWNTLLSECSSALNYTNQGDKLDGYKEITALIPAETGFFDKVSTIGGYVGTAAGLASGIYTMLGVVGIVESTNAKINHVRELVKEVQQSIVVLDEKIDKLGSSLTSGTVETMNAVQYNTYIIASGNWDQFISSYVIPLQNKMSEFEMAYNDYMLKYIMNAHTDSGAVTVWIDENNAVTLPHPANDTNTTKYSVDGVPLTITEVYHLSAELKGVQAKVMQNGGRLYDGYWDDIVAEINVREFVDVTRAEYLDSVQLNAVLYSLNTVGAVEFLNAYTNFCNAITGSSTSGSLKPLDNYLTMISMYYNFYVESANDIETTFSWLYSILAESSFIATLAYNFTPSAKEGLINECYDKTVKKITEAATTDKDPLYSYLGKKTVSTDFIVHYPYNTTNSLWLNHENDLYINEYKDNPFDNFLNPEYLKPGNYMDEVLVNLMIKRYENLYSSGVITSPTFRDYIISLGIVDSSTLYDENGDPIQAQIIVSPVTIEDIPADNSVNMKITGIEQSTWYNGGETITIGSQGNVDKKHYRTLTRRRANTIDFEGNTTADHTLLACAFYHEDHFYWRTEEKWYCIEMYTDPMLIFTLN